MAGDGGGNPRAQRRKILILLGFVIIVSPGCGLLDDLAQRPLQLSALQAHRGSFDRKCMWAKGFYLKSVALQLFGNAGKNHHLLGLEFHQQGHQ